MFGNEKVLKMSDEIVVKKAEAQLGIQYYTMYHAMSNSGLLDKHHCPHGITKAKRPK